jgi:hypothetical protein
MLSTVVRSAVSAAKRFIGVLLRVTALPKYCIMILPRITATSNVMMTSTSVNPLDNEVGRSSVME